MKPLLLILLLNLALFANTYPSLYAQLGTPLYKADVQLQTLSQYDTLQKNINSFSALSEQTLTFGQKLEQTADKSQNKNYLKKLRHLQKRYDELTTFLRKQLSRTIKQDNYPLFLAMINTESDLFFKTNTAKEAIYRYYKEHKGTEHSHYLDKRIEKERHTVVLYNTDSASIKTYSDVPTHTKNKRATRDNVTILSTPNCPYCRKAKNFLRSKRIAFTDYNINTSAQGKRLYRQYNGHGVPIVIINGSVIKGYNKQAMQSALR